MGRFYRTSNPTPIDYMYKDNTPLMENVIKANDAGITDDLGQTSSLSAALNFNHLEGDTEDVNNLVSGYSDKIDAITNDIRSNPAGWKKQLPAINQLKTQLHDDYNNGAISKYIGNYNRRQQAFGDIDKQVQSYNEGKGGIDPYSASVYKQNWDSKFNKTGYDSKTGNYNVYQGGSAMNNMDLGKILDDGLDKLKADKTKDVHEEPDKDPWYIDKVSGERVVLTPERILQTAMGNVSGDVMNYLRQRQGVGLIKGAVDDKGNLITPYSSDTQPLSDDEKDNINKLKDLVFKAKDPTIKQQYAKSLQDYTSQLQNRSSLNFNDDSYLAPYLRAAANKYRQYDTDNELTTRDNKKTATMFTQGQENYRTGLNLADKAAGRAQLQDQFNQKLDWDKYKFLNPQTKQFAPKAGTGKKIPDVPIDKVTGVSELGTRSFEDWNTTDPKTGQKIPIVSNEGLSADIDKYKTSVDASNTRLSQIDTQLTSPDVSQPKKAALQIEKQNLQTKLEQDQSELGLRRTLYDNISKEAIDNPIKYSGVQLSKTQKDLYSEFENDRDGSKYLASINKLKEKYPSKLVQPDLDSPSPYAKDIELESPEVLAARKKYADYISTKDVIDDNRKKVSDFVRGDVINADAIDLGGKDSKDVSDIILNNTQGSKVYDDTGKRTVSTDLDEKGISWFNPSGDNDQFELDNGKPDRNLTQYIKKNGVTMNVMKVGASTKLGDGNGVAQVSFNDPTGGIPNDKVYYISLGDKALHDIGTKFSNHKDPNVAKIANSLNDTESNNIRKQLMVPSFNRRAGISGYDESSTKLLIPSGDGRTIPLTVHRIVDGGAEHLNITMKDKDGKTVAFPRNDGKPAGVFNGTEDFISQLKQQK